MASIKILESLQEFKEAENIDRPTLIRVVEDVFRALLRRRYGADENFDVIVNDQTGDLEIMRRREIIAEEDVLDDELAQVKLSEAQEIDPDAGYDVGEELYELVDVLKEFGRRAILTAKQTLQGRIGDLKKKNLMDKYADRVGEIISGEVYQSWRKEHLLLDDDGNELIMPRTEQIPADFFKKGESVRAVVKAVEMRNNNPVIIISRTDPRFLEKLMEIEVPEIMDGLITIKKTVREPGERAKVAVESYDDRIDPVGACVGMKGSRIHGIVRELQNENIDIINWTQNINLLLQRSLTPARINRIDLYQDRGRAEVFLDPDQVSLAIGKKGINIKLAQQITGLQIDVYRDNVDMGGNEFDFAIEEFGDEIDGWVIDELKKVGYDTALAVLEHSPEDIARRTDLEIETAREVVRIMREEFDRAKAEEEANASNSKSDEPAPDENEEKKENDENEENEKKEENNS